MEKTFTCPYCNLASPAAEWNDATELDLGARPKKDHIQNVTRRKLKILTFTSPCCEQRINDRQIQEIPFWDGRNE